MVETLNTRMCKDIKVCFRFQGVQNVRRGKRNAKGRDGEETSSSERERGRGTIPVRRENFLEIKVVMCLDVDFVSLNNAFKLFHLRSIL